MVEKFRKTKIWLLDALHDDIEKLLNMGLKHKEIHDMIYESGVKIPFTTFERYLYKIRQKKEQN